jgi:hypothetical protein
MAFRESSRSQQTLADAGVDGFLTLSRRERMVRSSQQIRAADKLGSAEGGLDAEMGAIARPS